MVTDWTLAKCIEVDYDGVTRHPMPEHTSDDVSDQAFARMVCAECPLIDACHDLAQQERPRAGTWGGVTYTRASWPTPERACGVCETPIAEDASRTKRYCSRRCRGRAVEQRRGPRKHEPRSGDRANPDRRPMRDPEAMKQPCRTCGAQPGQVCTTPAGGPARPHAARRKKCPCGQSVIGRSDYCGEECRNKAERAQWREGYKRKARARREAAA